MAWNTKHTDRRPGSLAAEMDATNAYRAVFTGHPTPQQQQLVLADIAAKCGWNQITMPSSKASSEAMWFREGARFAFGLVYAQLTLSPADMQDFDNAVRREAALANSST